MRSSSQPLLTNHIFAIWANSLSRIVVALLLFAAMPMFSQGPPPPNGCDLFYALDPENDGFAEFNMADLFAYVAVDAMNDHGWDISGYTLVAYPSETDRDLGTNAIGDTYTNVNPFEQNVYIVFTYSGSGPVLEDPDLYSMECWSLTTIWSDGDNDFDGVPNGGEDLNGNGTLNDDNTDGDVLFNFIDDDDDNDSAPTLAEDYNGNGNPDDDDVNGNDIPDYLESGVVLNVNENRATDFVISPNPSSGATVITFSGVAPDRLFIFDVNGSLVRSIPLFANDANLTLNITGLEAGIYLLKVASQDKNAIKKLIVK